MDRFDVMWEPVRAFLVQVGEFFPRVMLALVILLLGWLIAKAVRFAVVKALRAINFNVLTEKAGIDAFLKQGGGETDTTDILGLLIYWLTILTALGLYTFAASFIGYFGINAFTGNHGLRAQIDRLTPFKAENVRFACRVVERRIEENDMSVDVAVVPRAFLAEIEARP